MKLLPTFSMVNNHMDFPNTNFWEECQSFKNTEMLPNQYPLLDRKREETLMRKNLLEKKYYKASFSLPGIQVSMNHSNIYIYIYILICNVVFHFCYMAKLFRCCLAVTVVGGSPRDGVQRTDPALGSHFRNGCWCISQCGCVTSMLWILLTLESKKWVSLRNV